MTHSDSDDHGPSLELVRGAIGAVSICPCGAITLTLQYLSLRFEPAAFRELQALLALAQHRLDGPTANAPLTEPSVIDASPVH